jgi:hypothetical protein
MHLERDFAEVIDAVRVAWRDANGTQRFTPWLYRDGVDRSDPNLRKPTVPADFPSAGAALQFARVYLAERSRPRITGSIQLGMDAVLTRPDGERVEGYRVQSGEWVEIVGYASTPVKMPIISTAIEMRPLLDQATGAPIVVDSVTIQLDEPASTSWAAMQRRTQDATSAARTKVDPVSGNARP